SDLWFLASDAVEDIRKCGYLRKQKHGHKRFFVLRAAGPLGPSRLEYYDSEKKFRTAAAAPSPPKRVIFLSQCFTVNKRADSKNKYLIALYTKDEYFAIVAESEQEQEDWYVAVSALMSEGKRGHVDSDDLDDGYGTVSPGTVFKEVWQVNVKPKGLGQTKNLTGVYRLCLSAKTVHLVKLNSDNPCVNLQLMNIRRCGHSESFFFIEVGRSSSIGPGEIWMQLPDGPTRHPLTVCGCLWRGSETHQLPMTHQEPQRPRPLPLPRRPDPAECAGTRLPASRTDSTTSPWS
uniref:Insulin receptor substrate 1 n=1 Tax=Oryzias latipes TaxID=8090 RepID=A0A3P9IHL7_ORYLA